MISHRPDAPASRRCFQASYRRVSLFVCGVILIDRVCGLTVSVQVPLDEIDEPDSMTFG